MTKQNFETCERLAGYILDWRKRRGRAIRRVNKKIESKGSTVFTRNDKIICSEIINEFGQQATKITAFFSLAGKGRIKIDKEKYPRLFEYISTTTFYPNLNVEFYA